MLLVKLWEGRQTTLQSGGPDLHSDMPWLALIFLWRSDHVETLGGPGTDRVGDTKRSTAIKTAG